MNSMHESVINIFIRGIRGSINRLSIPVIFNLLPLLLIEFHRPARFPIPGINLFRPAVIPNCLPLPIDLFHPVLRFPDGSFQHVLLIGQFLNLIVQLFQRTDLKLFQKNDYLRFRFNVVPLSPDLVAFPLAGAELRSISTNRLI